MTNRLVALLLLTLFSLALSGDKTNAGWVTITPSTYTYTGYNITLYPNNTIATFPTDQFKNFTLNSFIIETPYLKVTIIPEYGGRILSIIYKPTGKEQLYQNPIVVPFCWGCGSSYYNWMQVVGGIIPTFVEPEHGKFWLLPWNFSITEQKNDRLVIQLTNVDHVDYDTPPPNFVYGMTNLTAKVNIIINGNSSAVEYETIITNPQNTTVNYEFWVCETLTPGSKPGSPMSPLKSEIVLGGVNQTKVRDDEWPWMATVDAPIDAANHIYEFKNLRLFANWQDMGIAYANMTEPFSGVINQESQSGMFRYSNNTQIFPGLKMWTWGNESVNVDPTKDLIGTRPYIELWGGHSHQFFSPATLAPKQSKVAKFTYFPTVGLEAITALSPYGAVELTYSLSSTQVDLQAKVFTPFPSASFQVLLGWLDTRNQPTILSKTLFQSVAELPSIFVTTQPTTGLPAGVYKFTFFLQDLNGVNLLTGSTPITLS